MGIELVALQELAKSLISGALKKHLERVFTDAQNSIIEELRNGRLELEEVAKRDDFAGMCSKVWMAAVEGAASENIRIMSKLLVSELKKPILGKEKFYLWVEFIKSLIPEERVLLVGLYRADIAARAQGGSMESHHIHSRVQNWIRRELVGVGRVFETEDHLEQTGQGLQRTGFVISVAGGGRFSFEISPRGRELFQLVNANEWAEAAMADLEAGGHG